MNRSLKCVVIDDEPLARELIRSYVERTPNLELAGSFESASEAVKTVMTGDIDLIFLDIKMPLLNGVEFAAMIPRSIRVIYVTAYDSYALDAFRTNALDYLLKPVSYAEFMKAVGKAIEWFMMKDTYEASMGPALSGDTITVKADHRLIQMKTDTIKYVEVRKDHLLFFRTTGETVSSVMSMRDIEEVLPPSRFMRVHRSFIVNLSNVEVVERNRIVFGKTYIPISESKRDEFLKRMGAS
ncbi:MAG: LytTR family DNA-binding domain-containing protein [Muribaculaceae bacterium]|nr:LytTR family DNA-binding domain-containing protein [Muribaculaceae bacterium]MDE6867343.1 LytTR family DNA-binding domain-containing protein [Muribaculaceae bacterium]